MKTVDAPSMQTPDTPLPATTSRTDDRSDALARLLAATAAGDRTAFQELYDRSSSKLFGVVLRIVRDRSRAEDVLQDVYLRIWQRAQSFDARQGRPITWMAAVARNRAIDIVRAERPTQSLGEDGDEEEVFRAGGQVATGVDPAEMETLRHCLGEIAEDDRNLILLAYYEGYSREELADRFGMPVGTVKTRLRRGLGTLRGCLERR